MTNRNYSNTAVETTLTGAISAAATSLAVTDASGYPAAPFTVVLAAGTAQQEVVLVGTVSGTTFSSLTRGFDGTTAQNHAAGARVWHGIVAADVRNKRLDELLAPTAAVNMAGQRLTSLGEPQTPTDAPLRGYVDGTSFNGHGLYLGTPQRIENIPRLIIGQSSYTLPNGVANFLFFVSPVTKTITKLMNVTRGTAQAGATLARLGLYTVNESTYAVALVARTASDPTMFGSTLTMSSRNLDTTGGYPASYDVIAGVRYAFAEIIVGATTSPVLYGAFTQQTLVETSPRVIGTLSGQTDLPATATITGSNTGNVPWMAGE